LPKLSGVNSKTPRFEPKLNFYRSKIMTKNVLTKAALTLALALTAAAPSAFAKTTKKPKPSPEHVAAVKKCGADYSAAVKAAKTLKGKEHSAAVAKAKADRKQCLADAPK
jgi:hypothetical protein